MKEILLSMITALEMEIHATDQALGWQQGVALSFGTRESDDAKPTYRFHPASDMPSGTDDSWLLVWTRGKACRGAVSRLGFRNGGLAQKDHAPEISEARLVPTKPSC